MNGNASLAAVLTSRQFFTINNPALAPLALGSLYGADVYNGQTNPSDLRTVNLDFEPTFRTEEKQILAHLEQDLGKFKVSLSGGYTEGFSDSSNDYNLSVENTLKGNAGLQTLALSILPGAAFGGVNPLAGFAQVYRTLTPNGPNGPFCQSLPEPTGTGVYGGHGVCDSNGSLDFDRSNAYSNQWTAEGIFESKFDGPFNFLVGGIYLDYTVNDNSYYVNAFGLDYAAGILGAGSTGGRGYLSTPFYRNNGDKFRLKSYGLFGEGYLNFTNRLKLTVGLRYNNDDKSYRARTTLLNAPLLYGSTDFTQAIGYSALDFDASAPGAQAYAFNKVKFDRLTGRAVLDFQITPSNLLYASYSRGYKSGGINPPLSPVFTVPTTFGPETVDSFEIGSKNQFLHGTLRLNLTGFYYKYKNLQLSRIVARTAVNDNVDANIYGIEAEALIKPSRQWLFNMNFSYLHTEVASDKLLGNPQDPSGGRSDAVIIKDITNASNCAVASNSGNAAISNGFVTGVNNAINAGAFAANGVQGGAGLQGPVAVPGTGTTGAFSICSVLQAAAANPAAGVTVYSSGVPVNIRGNALPQSPTYKFSWGAQYTADLSNGWTIVPRFDFTYTGEYYGSIFNRNVNRIQGYAVMNAQVQLNGRDNRWYLRGFVQNLTNNNAITGLYVTDQSTGLFTNAFTLEPRRFGVGIGAKF